MSNMSNEKELKAAQFVKEVLALATEQGLNCHISCENIYGATEGYDFRDNNESTANYELSNRFDPIKNW